jgi:hypothetical protein
MSDPAASTLPPAPTAETLSGSDLAADLLGATAGNPSPVSVPDPVSIKIETAPTLKTAAVRDSLNREFDAKRFRTKPDGSPFLNARGAFMPRGGRKPGRATATATEPAPRASYVPPLPEAPKPAATAATGSPGPTVPPPAPQPAAPSLNRNAIDQTAEAYLRAGYTAADALFVGQGEWKPDDPAEHASLKEPLAEYLALSGAQPLPPWARLGVAVVAFVAKRFSRPNTKKTAAYYWRQATGAKPAQPVAPVRPAQPRAEVETLEIEPLAR